MSAPMRMRPTRVIVSPSVKNWRRMEVPESVYKRIIAFFHDEGIEVKEAEEMLSPNEAFKDLLEKYGRAGTHLRGLRFREELTQVELAKKLGITQADLSKIESGKRPIGKNLATRIGKLFKIDYRLFL